MSRSAAAVAIVVAMVLAVATLILVKQSGGSGSSPVLLLPIDPARVESLAVRAGGREGVVARSGTAGEWVLVPGGDRLRAWPIEPTRMRAACRILASLEGTASGQSPSGGTELVLRLEDGREWRVVAGRESLGGRLAVRVAGPEGERVATVDASQLLPLLEPGPWAWRDASALATLGTGTSRIEIESGDRRLVLGRVMGRWGLTEPVAARASDEAVAELLGRLGRIRVRDFADDRALDAQETGAAEPAATVTLTRDERRIEGEGVAVDSVRERLEIGGPADLAGSASFARVRSERRARGGEWTVERDAIVAVGSAEVTAIAIDPRTYIDRRSVGTPAADVHGLSMRGEGMAFEVSRALDRWELAASDGPRPMDAADAREVEGLLDVLCRSAAAGMGLDRPEEIDALGELEVRGLGGAPVARLELWIAGETGRLVVRDGAVWRSYEGGASVRDWAAEMARRAR